MHLLTKSEYSWVQDEKGYKFCRIESQNKDLKFYSGVTRVLAKGEITLKDKLVAELGEKEGKKKLDQIYSRGTAAHSKLENNKKSYLSNVLIEALGKHLGDECLLYSTIFGKNIIGFADSVYQNKDGTYSIIDFKTKSSKQAFEKYDKKRALENGFNQLVAYSVLFKLLYNEQIESTKLITIFLDKKNEPEVFTLHRDNFLPYAQNFANKIKL